MIVRYPSSDRLVSKSTQPLSSAIAAGSGSVGGYAHVDSDGNVVEPTRLLNTSQTPGMFGQVQVTGSNLKWRGTSATQTAKKLGDTWTVNVPLATIFAAGTAAPVMESDGNGLPYWSRNPAAGAETFRFYAPVPYRMDSSGYGSKLTSITWAYVLGVVNATSVDARCWESVFAQGAAPVITAHGGAVVDGDYDTNHNTAAKRIDCTVAGGEHLVTLTLNTPAFANTANSIIIPELIIGLAATGTLKLRGCWMTHTVKEQ